MKQIKFEESLRINKAVLTPTAIQCLEKLQDEDNFGLDAICTEIAATICFLGQCITLLDEDCHKEIMSRIAALAQVQKTVEELRKPVVKN